MHGRDGTDAELCDVCYWRKRAEQPEKTGDIWHEAVSRTLYVYIHEEIAKEAIDYLLAEVQTMLDC